MRITIEHYGNKYTCETEHDEITLTEVLCLFGGLLRSAGFSFNGEVDIVSQEDYENPDKQREDTE